MLTQVWQKLWLHHLILLSIWDKYESTLKLIPFFNIFRMQLQMELSLLCHLAIGLLKDLEWSVTELLKRCHAFLTSVCLAWWPELIRILKRHAKSTDHAQFNVHNGEQFAFQTHLRVNLAVWSKTWHFSHTSRSTQMKRIFDEFCTTVESNQSSLSKWILFTIRNYKKNVTNVI